MRIVLLIIMTACLVSMCTGCGADTTVLSKSRINLDGVDIDVREICYKGIVYVVFNPHSNAPWGGAMLNIYGKPITCESGK